MAVAASGQGGVLVRVDPAKSEKVIATTTALPDGDAWQRDDGMASSRLRRHPDQAPAGQMGHDGDDICAHASRQVIDLLSVWLHIDI